MKMKRFLAVFLIALMATAVVSAAGVLTAPKAAATNGGSLISIKYAPGKTYVFTPWKYNIHESYSMVAEGRHYEFSTGGTAFSKVQANGGAVASGARVGVGLDLLKYGVPSDALSNPCKVTMKVSYSIVDEGGSSSQAWLSVSMGPQISTYEVSGTDKLPIKSGIKTFTWTGTVEEFIKNNYAFVETQTHTQTGQAVAQAYVSCITISFPYPTPS